MSNEELKPFISVIIPCWNEEKNLENGVLDEVHSYLSIREYLWEVIIVDDESTDNSVRLIETFMKGKEGYRLLRIPHGGKPEAVWAGIRAASGELLLLADMDQSTPINELRKFLPWYGEGYDVIIGSRGTERTDANLLRKIGSLVFLTFRRLILLRDIVDTQCGFKSCRREVALKIFPRLEYFNRKGAPSGWRVSAYDVELLYLMAKFGYRIKEVKVQWQNRDRSETKKKTSETAKYVGESIEMAREVLRVKINQLKGLYDGR